MTILRSFAIWLALFAITFGVLLAFDVNERISVRVLGGVVLAGLAHICASPQWKRISSTELNPFSRKFGSSPLPAPAPVVAREPRKRVLETKAARVSFLVMLLGALICGVTFAVFVSNNSLERALRIYDFSYSYGWYKSIFTAGAVIALLGAVGAFAFGHTVAPLLTWIRTGHFSRDEP